jgi:aralkylamine N-acetyltransferase
MVTMSALEISTPDGIVMVTRVTSARPEEMRELYKAGDWWDDTWDEDLLSAIVEKSFAFVAAVAPEGRWIGMGRLISDGVSDAYMQDIVVLSEWKGHGIGSAIVKCLLLICKESGIDWIGTISEPETEYFYRRFGFARMNRYTPMLYER